MHLGTQMQRSSSISLRRGGAEGGGVSATLPPTFNSYTYLFQLLPRVPTQASHSSAMSS